MLLCVSLIIWWTLQDGMDNNGKRRKRDKKTEYRQEKCMKERIKINANSEWKEMPSTGGLITRKSALRAKFLIKNFFQNLEIRWWFDWRDVLKREKMNSRNV